jgi:hypothetical protein
MAQLKGKIVMELRKAGCFYLGIMLMIAAAGTSLATENPDASLDISVDYAGKYIWRGQNVNDESVLQPNLGFSAYGFSGSIWANIDLTNGSQTIPDNAGEFQEVDYALDYSNSVPNLDKLGFSVGVIHYLFMDTSAISTTEVYAGVSLDIPTSPFFTWYGDVNAIDGSYLQFGVGHTFEQLAGSSDYNMGLDLSGAFAYGTCGYNDGYFGIDEGGWNDFTMGIGVPITLKHFTLTPKFNLSTMLSDKIGNATYERTNAWFSLSFSKSF